MCEADELDLVDAGRETRTRRGAHWVARDAAALERARTSVAHCSKAQRSEGSSSLQLVVCHNLGHALGMAAAAKLRL